MKITGVLLAALLLAGCADKAEANIPGVESEIAAGLQEKVGGAYEVECPDHITWKAGGEFHCFATDSQGESARITVSMENAEGEWSWVVD
jgi:hypothetical protein